jgi:hypothetical protein
VNNTCLLIIILHIKLKAKLYLIFFLTYNKYVIINYREFVILNSF